MIIALLFGGFFLLLLLGVPVVWSMAAATIITLIFGDVGVPVGWLAQQTIRGADSISLMAIPLFLFAGELMNRGGLTRQIMRIAEHIFGRFRGGLGLVNVATSFVYGGLTGSATADTGAVAKVMIPAMEERGYPKAFAAAVTAASGTLGIILPPSVVFIIYGVLTNTSIGGLFMAGILPGVLLALTFMVAAYVVGVKEDFPRQDTRPSWRRFFLDLRAALPALLMPPLILGSIVSGLATATEAAALSVIYALLVGALVYRELSWDVLWPSIIEAVSTTGAIMIIMAVAVPFSWLLTVEQVPQTIATWITSLHGGAVVDIVLVILALVVVGLWLDLGPALIILAPILVPIAQSAGLEPYQIGVLFTVTLGVGLFTPPVGTNIFVVCNVAKLSIGAVSRRLVPFWVASAVAIVLLVIFPELTEWLPRMAGY